MQIALLLLAFAVMAALPLVADSYVVTVVSLFWMYAYLGGAWNLMFGYAGQLSLGHALFFGLGAYVAAVLSDRYGINAWIAVGCGATLSGLVGATIAYLGFRFSVRGHFFALLTVAVAEFVRIAFENWNFIGGSAGYFLQVSQGASPLLTLRGDATFYYYAFFTLGVCGLLISYALTRSSVGYYWCAIREDEDAARALGVPAFRMKILAAVVSAAMTSIGGSLYAFFSGSLFPETTLGMRFSIEILIAPIIGGVGTVIGPIVGALFVVPVMELSNHLSQASSMFGLNTLFYGLIILLTVRFLPGGVWPAIWDRLFASAEERNAAPAAAPTTSADTAK